MSTSVTLNATSYTIPATADDGWGDQVSAYLIAIATGVLTKSGGAFTLTAEVDFGATYGLKAPYFKSRGTVATAGQVRLANTEVVSWRNALNDGNLNLKVNSSNVLEFNGAPIVTLALGAANYTLRMNSGGTAYEWGTVVNAQIDAAAAIAYSKLATMTAGSVLLGNVSNVATVTAITGDVTIDSSGVTAIGSTKVTNGMLAGSIAYSKLALTGAILNADLAGSITYSKLSLSAGDIPYSKLTLTGAVTNSDLAGSIAYSKLSLTGAILNADLAGSIAYSKLSLTGVLFQP